MPTKRKYIETSSVAKHEAIADLNSGMSIRTVARKNGASIDAVCNWKRQEDKLSCRMNLVQIRGHQDSKEDLVDNWKQSIPGITQEYDSSDI